MAINLLPTEILLHILEHLVLRDIAVVVRVCKLWKRLGSPQLFRMVFLACEPGETVMFRPSGDGLSRPGFDVAMLGNEHLVRHLTVNIDDTTYDFFDSAELIRPIQIFQNVTTLLYSCSAARADCVANRGFLTTIINLMPLLRRLEVALYVDMYLGVVPELGRVGDANGEGGQLVVLPSSLKQVHVLFEVSVSSRNHIDEFFRSLKRALGDGVEDLIVGVDISLNVTTAAGPSTQQSDNNTQQKSWRLNNVRKLRFMDYEGLYPLTDVVSGRFGELRWLNVSIEAWRFLVAELEKCPEEEGKIFPNVEMLGIMLIMSWKMPPTDWVEDEEQGYWSELSCTSLNISSTKVSRLLEPLLKHFPKLKEFRVSLERTLKGFCISRMNGVTVIGQGHDLNDWAKDPWWYSSYTPLV
ncbi:hypothetical protein TWF730_003575 [Orbilia blumenaviensis]|uniref:F-box domain-containing protein n=1 Tax=Orbilia blumenaviensis TaxID=1796055 RepID=A0AAV9U2W9_9PEZI